MDVISAAESSANAYWLHDCSRMNLLELNLSGMSAHIGENRSLGNTDISMNEIQLVLAGQPAAIDPLPVYCL